jgi:hypothetical protein
MYSQRNIPSFSNSNRFLYRESAGPIRQRTDGQGWHNYLQGRQKALLLLLRHAPNNHSPIRKQEDLGLARHGRVPFAPFALRHWCRGRSRHRGISCSKFRDAEQVACDCCRCRCWCRGRGTSVWYLDGGCRSCLAIRSRATPFDGRCTPPSPTTSGPTSARWRTDFVWGSGRQVWRAVRVCRIDDVINLARVGAVRGAASVKELHEVAEAIRPIGRAKLRARAHRHVPVRQHDMLSKRKIARLAVKQEGLGKKDREGEMASVALS